MNEPLLLSHGEAMRQLGGIGRSTFYGLIETGELTQVHIGRRGFITADSINAYVERLKKKVDGEPL